jgi:hypothetical protein
MRIFGSDFEIFTFSYCMNKYHGFVKKLDWALIGVGGDTIFTLSLGLSGIYFRLVSDYCFV